MQNDQGEASTPPPPDTPEARPHDDERRPGDRINVGGGDDSVVRLQLAARWAEEFSPRDRDSLNARLRRFRKAYDFLDAVMHGIDPSDLDDYDEYPATVHVESPAPDLTPGPANSESTPQPASVWEGAPQTQGSRPE
jgi:hypothetical protein